MKIGYTKCHPATHVFKMFKKMEAYYLITISDCILYRYDKWSNAICTVTSYLYNYAIRVVFGISNAIKAVRMAEDII